MATSADLIPRPRRGGAKRDTVLLPTFIGSQYSNEECAFLLEHLGEPSELAIPEDEELPVGVNPAAVVSILDITYRLNLIDEAAREKHPDADVKTWVGFDRLRDILTKTLEWNGTVAELKERTRGSSPEMRRAAASPSLHFWDPDTDIPYLYGIGADADIVRTMLGEGGQRVPLYTELREVGIGSISSLAGVAKFLRSKTPQEQMARRDALVPSKLSYDKSGDYGTVTCPICGFAETYTLNKPSEKKDAQGKVMHHLSQARIKQDVHRKLLQRLNSGRAGRIREPHPNEESETEGVEA